VGEVRREYHGDKPEIPEEFIKQVVKDRKDAQIAHGPPAPPQDYPTIGITPLTTLDLANKVCRGIRLKTKRLLMKQDALNCVKCHRQNLSGGALSVERLDVAARVSALPKMLAQHFKLESKPEGSLSPEDYDKIGECLVEIFTIKLNANT